MDTLAMDDPGQINFESVRCIGCGLCTGVCPTGSMKLVIKPEPEQPKIPRDTTETYIQIARVQGVGKLFNLVKMWLFHQFRRITIWMKPGK
jgi:Fe-S-cluster-containing hydrogenase component 2